MIKEDYFCELIEQKKKLVSERVWGKFCPSVVLLTHYYSMYYVIPASSNSLQKLVRYELYEVQQLKSFFLHREYPGS